MTRFPSFRANQLIHILTVTSTQAPSVVSFSWLISRLPCSVYPVIKVSLFNFLTFSGSVLLQPFRLRLFPSPVATGCSRLQGKRSVTYPQRIHRVSAWEARPGLLAPRALYAWLLTFPFLSLALVSIACHSACSCLPAHCSTCLFPFSLFVLLFIRLLFQ